MKLQGYKDILYTDLTYTKENVSGIKTVISVLKEYENFIRNVIDLMGDLFKDDELILSEKLIIVDTMNLCIEELHTFIYK